MHTHPPPQAVDERASTAMLRTVAVFEAVKGIAVLLLGLGLLSLLHRDVEEAAERVLVVFHLGQHHRLSRAFLELASHVTDGRLWALAFGALVYATVRCTEAWGLWYRRVWAEWFGLLSGTLYLPYEIIKVVEKPNFWHLGLLATNLAIVLYLAWVRLAAWRRAV